MNNELSLVSVSSLLSIAGVAYLAFWRFRPLCMDSFRQNVFDARDELFDYADAGNIDFSHPAYVQLRSMMNGYIRFAHHLSLWQSVILVAFTSREDQEYLRQRSFIKNWKQATSELDPEVKRQLEQYRERMQKSAVFYFMITSPVSFLIIMLCAAMALVRDPKLRAEINQRIDRKTATRIHDSFGQKTRRVLHETKAAESVEMKEVFSGVALIYGESPA